MNTQQVDQVLRAALPNTVRMLGTFAADQLPKTLPAYERAVFIANTDPARLPGEHWVGFYSSPRERLLEFFDSCAHDPSAYVHLRIPFPTTSITCVLKRPVQSLTSAACGQHCIHFLARRANGTPLHAILRNYDFSKLTLNDANARKFVHKVSKYVRQTGGRATCSCIQCCCMRCECSCK